jgi:hypothetical protein
MKATERFCHCGKPLHYTDPAIQASVQKLVDELGESIPVTTRGRTWLVPRHYIALHGLKAGDAARLGFQEVKP